MRWLMIAVPAALILSGCGNGDNGASTQVSTDPPRTSAAPAATEPPATPAGVQAGTASTIQTTLADGTDLTYVVVVPESFDPSREYPVVLAMPPGGQSLDVTRSVTAGTYAPQALARGWAVVSPVAPGGTLYFQGSEELIPEFLDETLGWLQPEGGRYHLVGVSNGGISAFRLAALAPDRYASLLVFPGFPRSTEDQAALPQLEIPISMFVGGEDTSWIGPMQEAFDLLQAEGANVSFEIRPGEGHRIESLSDGTDIFDFFDSVR